MNEFTGQDILDHLEEMKSGPMGSTHPTDAMAGAIASIASTLSGGNLAITLGIADLLVEGTQLALAALDLGDPAWEE